MTEVADQSAKKPAPEEPEVPSDDTSSSGEPESGAITNQVLDFSTPEDARALVAQAGSGFTRGDTNATTVAFTNIFDGPPQKLTLDGKNLLRGGVSENVGGPTRNPNTIEGKDGNDGPGLQKYQGDGGLMGESATKLTLSGTLDGTFDTTSHTVGFDFDGPAKDKNTENIQKDSKDGPNSATDRELKVLTSEQMRKNLGLEANPNLPADAKKVEDAVDAIRKASEGLGTDEKAIWKALEGKTEAEIRAMRARYKEKFGVTLDDELKSELTVPMFGDIHGEYKKAQELLNVKDKIDPAAERTRLDEAAKKNMTPQEYQQFQARMKEFEARKGKDGLSDEEVARTYREVSRLLEAKGDSPLNADQRKKLAMQIMENAADPTKISQGSNNTCNVTTVETAMYTRNPSEAARMVTDVALTGKYITRDGTVIENDPRPKTDASEAYPPRQDGVRVHASEIFQITAVNVAYAQNGVARRYDQVRTAPNSGDNGERLWDTSKTPPEEVTSGNPPKPVRSPGLPTGDLVDIYKKVTGQDILAFQSDVYGGRDNRVINVNSPAELAEKLAEAKKAGRLPAIILVNTAVEPLWGDSGGGAAGGSGGAHVITVTDFEPGPPPKVNVDNQWNTGVDYQGNKKMSVDDLYRVMQPTASVRDAVQKEVDQARKEGRVDFAKEVDLLRMKKMAEPKISEADYQKELNDLIKRQGEDFRKRGDKVSPQERERVVRTLTQVADGQPIARQLETFGAMAAAGIIPMGPGDKPDTYEYRVGVAGWRLALQKKDLEAKGQMTGEAEKKYQEQVKTYQDYIKSLPEEMQKRILEQIKKWGT